MQKQIKVKIVEKLDDCFLVKHDENTSVLYFNELDWIDKSFQETLKIDDELEVLVINSYIEGNIQRFTLSRKHLLPNPWKLLKKGITTQDIPNQFTGKINQILDFGILFTINFNDQKLMGIIHKLDIPKDIDKSSDYILKIKDISVDQEKILFELIDFSS